MELQESLTFLLSSYLSVGELERAALLEFRDQKQVANVVNQEFMSAIDKQCSLCGDDAEKLLEYLGQGQGLILLLSLVIYADKTTSCCGEVCNLLLSLLPLSFSGDNDDDENLHSAISSFSDLCGYPRPASSFRYGLKDQVFSTLSQSTKSSIEKSVESTFKLDKIVLQRPELFMCLLSALLGISSGEIVSKDSMLQLSLICKACNFLKASSAALQKANPSSFQFRMILRYAFVSLMELLNYTSIEYIIENPAFIEFLATGTELAENLSGEEWKVSNTFWKVESIIEVVQAVWSMLSWGLSMKAQFSDDITELMRKFIDCGIIQLTRNAGDIVSKLMHLLEEVTTGTTDFEFAPVISKDSREQLCSQHLDGLNSLLVKLIKKYRRVRKGRACILSVCTDVQRLGKRKQRTSGRKSHGNKPNSSTTESEKESQDVENLSSQSSSTEDMSDYIMKLSDSEEEKPKRERAKLELTITKPKPGGLCLIGSLSTLLGSLYVLSDGEKFGDFILHLLPQIGLCTCMNTDELIMNLLTRLDGRLKQTSELALIVVSDILREGLPFLSTSSIDSPLQITNPKTKSGKAKSPSYRQETSMGLDATDFADESSRQHAPKPHQFLGKYYDYLKHGNEDLKSLLAAHFLSVTPKLYGNVESEFFKKVILPFILENVQLTEGDGKPIVDDSDVTILNTIIELLPYAFETKDLLHTFHHKNGIKYLECLVLHDEFGRSSMKVLQLLASSGDGRKIFGIFEEKSVRIARNLSGKSKLSKSLKELSVEVVCIRAVDALLNAGRKLFEDLQGKTDDQRDPQVVSLFLNLMKVYNELVADCDYFTEEFLKREWPERCFELLQDLTDHVEAIKEAVRDKEKDETDSGKKTADGLGMIKRNKIAELEILLPMCLRFAGHGSSYKVLPSLTDIINMLSNSFMHPVMIGCHLGKDVCVSLLRSCLTTAKRTVIGAWISRDSQRKVSKAMSNEEDDDLSESGQEEGGYEADSESESEADAKRLTDTSSPPQSPVSKGSSVGTITTKSIEAEKYAESLRQKVAYPELCIFVLESLARQMPVSFETDSHNSILEILSASFKVILEFMQNTWRNCVNLSGKGLMKLLVNRFGLLFKCREGKVKEIQEHLGQMIVLLSACSITSEEYRTFLGMFQGNYALLHFLTSILLEMAKVSFETWGAIHSLVFPVPIDDQVLQEKGKTPAMQRSHTFLIPKRDGQSRSILRHRSTSWTGKIETSSYGSLSYGFRSQACAWEIAPVQLPLKGNFVWPDRGFSISVWFQIQDRKFGAFISRDRKPMSGPFMERRRSRRRMNSGASDGISGSTMSSDAVLFHLASFGSINALFEIWVGSRPGQLEYRWIVSNYGESDENLSNFDQVILPANITPNKWHHLVITLVLPQNLGKPHTAKIMSFLNGYEQNTVQMKYPSRLIVSQARLSSLIGHSYKKNRFHFMEDAEGDTNLHVGNLMIFQGSESFMFQQRSARGDNPNTEGLINKVESVYLYALGPNASHLKSEFHDHFSTPMTSHMDSSLNWDSIQFKEMAFCTNIMSEQLVSGGFPIELLIDTIRHVPLIEASLQECLLLTYTPRRSSEFYQQVPVVRSRTSSLSKSFSSSLGSDDSNVDPRSETITENAKITANLLPRKRETFQEAIHNVGGMTVLIYLFAKVSEDMKHSEEQAALLRTIFLVQDKCLYLKREMNDVTGLLLMHKVLKASPRELDFVGMKAIMESICDGNIFTDADATEDGFLQVNTVSSAIVKNVSMLQTLVLDWHLWDKTPLLLQETLWKALETLVRPCHPFHAFNVMQFQRGRVVEHLLMGCQERQQENAGSLPPTLSQLYISVIQNLLGQPPDLPTLKAVCNFLIAVHPTLDTLTLHSSANFYLIPRIPDIHAKAKLSIEEAYTDDFLGIGERRTQSFNEGYLRRKLQRTHSGDSVLSFYSHVSQIYSSAEESPREGEEYKYPKSEVIFRKDSRVHKTVQFDQVDASTGAADSSPGSLQISEDQEQSKNADTKRKFGPGNVHVSTPVSKEQPKPNFDLQEEQEDDKFETQAPTESGPTKDGSGRPAFLSKFKSPNLVIPGRGHRRNRSLDVKFSNLLTTNVDTRENEYDIISDSELPSSFDRGSDEYLVVDGLTGQKVGSFTPTAGKETFEDHDMLYYLRLGLFEVLQTILTLLPDNMVTRVFGTILKVEHLLVLVNQENEKLREVAVQNLSLYLQRGGRDCIDNFKRFMGFHLLANQLHQYSGNAAIGGSCLSMLTGKSLLLNEQSLSKMDISGECPIAIVSFLALLEESVQRPALCHILVESVIKVFDSVENLPLIAFDQGMAEVVSNMVCVIATTDNGYVRSKWKKDVFGDILNLVNWIVKKACCTCQTLYFQMFKDLVLVMEMLETKERERKGPHSGILTKCSRFLQYYMLQTALELFRTTDLYMTTSRMRSIPGETVERRGYTLPRLPRRSSVARTILNRIKTTMHVVTPPTVATPGEVQERFMYVCTEAVNLATLFHKAKWKCESVLYGQSCKDLSATFHSTLDETRGDSPTPPSLDSDKIFCRGLLHYLLDAVSVGVDIISDTFSWTVLVRATKDEIFTQTSRLLVYLLSPLREAETRFRAIEQLLYRSQNKTILQTIMQGISGVKNRDRLLSCLSSALNTPTSQLSKEKLHIIKQMKELLKTSKLEFVDVAEQQLFQEMREIKVRSQKQELNRRKDAYKRNSDRGIDLSKKIASYGLEVTKVVVEEQDRQRQRLLRSFRGIVSKEVEIRKLWRKLIHHMTQERKQGVHLQRAKKRELREKENYTSIRAPWYDPSNYPKSWQLDPTEGPCRVRKRLQRCHVEVPLKFFLPDKRKDKEELQESPLAYLFQTNGEEDRPTYYSFKTNDTIRFLYHCSSITPATKALGEVLIGETHMYFVGEEFLTDQNITQVVFGDKDVISISWRYEEIREILKRRYALQDNALEIFLTSGRTFLLAFESSKSRDEVFEQLSSRELPNLITNTVDLHTLTNRWRDGIITNFEYLTELNKKAGRSFSDLMQYPVFPFILADYKDEFLDLSSPSCFRDLSKPIAVQHQSREQRYVENYKWLKEEYEKRKVEDPEEATPPYHYGSHYSNSGTVLHFLVRLPPFTTMFLKYQDNQFDIPDRTFHSMATTWHLSSYASSSDVKELIPEFFFSPEFLENLEGYDFGVRQNGMRVSDVILPPWANGDARLFILTNRQALESPYVSSTLHNWIDLVFGYQQTGSAAIKAINVFHPATYFGVDVNAVRDQVKRRAIQTMIETYGQTPCQLFTSPHIQRFTKPSMSPLAEMLPIMGMEPVILSGSLKDNSQEAKDELQQITRQPLKTVAGLNWGNYCGSPSQQEPVVQWIQHFEFIPNAIIPSSDGLLAFVVGKECALIMPEENVRDNRQIGRITWGYGDGLLRVRSLTKKSTTTCFNPMRPDEVTCCAFVPGAEILLIGGSSGILSVWPVKYSSEPTCLDVIGAKQNLLGHSKAVTSIVVCRPYSIAVTGSEDCTAIIWDLNRPLCRSQLSYLFTQFELKTAKPTSGYGLRVRGQCNVTECEVFFSTDLVTRLCYVRSIPEHEASITCIAVSKISGDIVTSCDTDRGSLLYLWTVNANEIGKAVTEMTINCVGFSCAPEGISVNVVAAGLDYGVIRLWSTWTMNHVTDIHYNSHPYPVVCLAYSYWDPQHLYTCDQKGNILLWTRKGILLHKSPAFVSVTS